MLTNRRHTRARTNVFDFQHHRHYSGLFKFMKSLVNLLLSVFLSLPISKCRKYVTAKKRKRNDVNQETNNRMPTDILKRLHPSGFYTSWVPN